MVYTSSNSLRDREYAKFNANQTGSLVAINTSINNNMKIYSFPIGSLTALDTGAPISGGNFQSFSDIPLIGELRCIEWVHGNNTNGSLFIQESGGAGLQIWGTITRSLTGDFAVMPRAYTVNTVDFATGSDYVNIPLNNYIKIIGSDIGIGKSGLSLRIVYL